MGSSPQPQEKASKAHVLSSDYGDGVQFNMSSFKLQSKTKNLSINKRMAIGIIGIIERPLQAWGGLHCVNLNKKKVHKNLKANQSSNLHVTYVVTLHNFSFKFFINDIGLQACGKLER